jgi:hypothetical protein
MTRPSRKTLIWGTANPEGLAESYQGIYLNSQDIQSMVAQVNDARSRNEPIPVKIEHGGADVGRVVSAWNYNNTLQCVLELDESTLEGSIGSQFVRDGRIRDLSLGYSCEIEHSKQGLRSRKKGLREISIVKKGARHKCHIHAYYSSKG